MKKLIPYLLLFITALAFGSDGEVKFSQLPVVRGNVDSLARLAMIDSGATKTLTIGALARFVSSYNPAPAQNWTSGQGVLYPSDFGQLVGINTMSPDANLTINGNCDIDAYAAIHNGYFLQDSSGLYSETDGFYTGSLLLIGNFNRWYWLDSATCFLGNVDWNNGVTTGITTNSDSTSIVSQGWEGDIYGQVGTYVYAAYLDAFYGPVGLNSFTVDPGGAHWQYGNNNIGTLPNSDGLYGHALITDGSGVWSFGNQINFGTGGQNISQGTFDNGTGGNQGISLNCAIGYELNWQGGHLSNSTNNGSTQLPLQIDNGAYLTALAGSNPVFKVTDPYGHIAFSMNPRGWTTWDNTGTSHPTLTITNSASISQPGLVIDGNAGGIGTAYGTMQAGITGSATETGIYFNNTGTGGQDYNIFSTDAGSDLGAGNLVIGSITNSASRILINSTGYVGIGSLSPSSLLTVGSGNQFQVGNDGNIIYLRNVNYSWPSSQGQANSILTNDGAGNLTWNTPTSGVYLPTITDSLSVGGITVDSANYLRVGNVVTVSGVFYTSISLAAGNIINISLPFASSITKPNLLAGAYFSTAKAGGPISGDLHTNNAGLLIIATTFLAGEASFHFTYSIR